MLQIDDKQDGDSPPSRHETSVTHATQEMGDLTATSSGAITPPITSVGPHRFREARHIIRNFHCHSRSENSGSAAVSHNSLLRIFTHSVAASLGVGGRKVKRCRVAPPSEQRPAAAQRNSFTNRESSSSCCTITSIKNNNNKKKQNGVYWCVGAGKHQTVSARVACKQLTADLLWQ